MSQLDRHVGRVQNKLALSLFLSALGVALAGLFAVVILAVAVDRLGHIGVPRAWTWVGAGTALAVIAAAVYAVARRPSQHQAAVAIDRKLGLAEKFSTALYARSAGGTTDPFAAAAVLDAERTADNVSLYRQFPMPFPRTGYWAMSAAVVMLLALWLLPELDLFGREARRQDAARHAAEVAANRAQVQQALAKVSAFPKSVQNAPQVQLAKAEANQSLNQNTIDHTEATDSAMKLLEAASKSNLEEIKEGQKFAQATTNQQLFNSLNPAADDKGPVADATRDIAKGNFAGAMNQLQSLPQKFNDMTPAEQKKAADQMAKMANQLAKMANDPGAMKQLQQQMQQLGANPQQAQQLAQAVQQAAQGNPQAQQQLQQMQQQMTKQMNGGKGPTQQQQQAIQQAVQQMQAAANTQQTAQQMSSAAQQMASAMQQGVQAPVGQKQAAQQGQQQAAGKQGGQQMAAKPGAGQQQAGQKPGGQQQQAGGQQQANAAQQANGQQAGAQQQSGGQQQASGNQSGGQKPGGNQPGGSGNQPGQGQGMAQAQQQMQDALAQMDAVQKDAQQMAAAQANGGDGSNPADNPPPPGQGGQAPGAFGPKGPAGNGMGGPGIGNGGVGKKQVASFTVKQEMDPSQSIANGRMLAKTFVKAPQDKGTSTIQFTRAAAAAVKDATDDVPEESVPKDAQSTVKKYFETMDSGN